MAKRFVIPFAASGDKTVTPDATDPAGAISYSQGWPVAYQLADTDPNYRPVGRQEMNGVLNDITGAIAELQTLGFPEWVAVSGLVAPYRINAWVRHNDVVYVSSIANNSGVPGAVGSGWIDFNTLTSGRQGTTQKFETTGTYTPSAGMKFVVVEVVGAGGGSGVVSATSATQTSTAGGGAAGSYAKGILTAAQIGASQAITVGVGGVGGNISSGNGATGGASSVGYLIVAPGGGGSTAGVLVATTSSNLAPGGTPGAPATGGGILNNAGNQGQYGIVVLSNTLGGIGGNTPVGSGGSAGGASFTPTSGSGYGSGAGGPSNGVSSPVKNGVQGRNGVVILTEYF